MSIVIVDDSKVNRLLLRRILEDRGMKDLFEAEDVAQLFSLIGFEESSGQPVPCPFVDLVLMDIMMPEVDGIEACRLLRESKTFHDIPVIMVTAAGEGELLEKAFSAGATDYLTKPIDAIELVARVKSAMMLKKEMDVRKARERELLDLHEKLMQTNSNLKGALLQIQKDLEAAAQTQLNMLPPRGKTFSGMITDWQLLPCSRIGGDFLNLIPLSDRHTCFFLVDVSGHGVQAALLAFSLSQMLSNSGSEGNLLTCRNGSPCLPSEVLVRLNRRFIEEERLGQYFTIIYGVFDFEKKTVTISRAGHPLAIHLGSSGGTPQSLKDGGPPIGMVSEAEFPDVEFPVTPGDRLFFYSDGITETQSQDGNVMLGENGLLRILSGHQQHSLAVTLEDVMKACEELRGSREQADDMSILGIQFL